MASAPPNGSVLATSEPARLTVSARRWVIPGSAPVMVKVNGEQRAELQHGQQHQRAGIGSPRSGSRISRPADPGDLRQSPDQQDDGQRQGDRRRGRCATTPCSAATRAARSPRLHVARLSRTGRSERWPGRRPTG